MLLIRAFEELSENLLSLKLGEFIQKLQQKRKLGAISNEF